MVIVEPQRLKAEMAATDFTEMEITAAKGKLTNFKKPHSQQNFSLVMAMTRILQGKSFTAAIFKAADEVHTQSLKESQKVFKVPRIYCPDLDEGPLKQWIIHPESLSDLPDDFDARTHWLVDDGCDRKQLGPGVRHVELAMRKNTLFRDKGDSCLALEDAPQRLALPPIPLPSADEDAGAGATEPTLPRFATLPAQAQPQAQSQDSGKARVLKREDSTPGGEVELILDVTEEAFANGNLVSHDPQAPTATFHLRYFVSWAKRMLRGELSAEIVEVIRAAGFAGAFDAVAAVGRNRVHFQGERVH